MPGFHVTPPVVVALPAECIAAECIASGCNNRSVPTLAAIRRHEHADARRAHRVAEPERTYRAGDAIRRRRANRLLADLRSAVRTRPDGDAVLAGRVRRPRPGSRAPRP